MVCSIQLTMAALPAMIGHPDCQKPAPVNRTRLQHQAVSCLSSIFSCTQITRRLCTSPSCAVCAALLGAHQPSHAASSVEHLFHPGQAHGWRDQIQGDLTQIMPALQDDLVVPPLPNGRTVGLTIF